MICGDNVNIYRLPPPGADELRITPVLRPAGSNLCAANALATTEQALLGWLDCKTARALAKDLVAMADAAERAT